MTENEPTVFRKKALERMSSPEQLTDYLCVTNPGIWVLLAAVILLLGALYELKSEQERMIRDKGYIETDPQPG